jgi:hypothetical protein
MNIEHQLTEKFVVALAGLVDMLDASDRSRNLSAIGIVTDDSVDSVGASLLFMGDLPDDAPSYQRLSPVEWPHANESLFADLNQSLKAIRPPSGESDEGYQARVALVVDACIAAVRRVDLHHRFPSLTFVTFAGVDPSPVLQAAEENFVRQVNSPALFAEWQREFG